MVEGDPPVVAPVIGPIPPKRGGIHPTYGVYIGGADLDQEYKTKGTKTTYT
jgi:hypothetical protein